VFRRHSVVSVKRCSLTGSDRLGGGRQQHLQTDRTGSRLCDETWNAESKYCVAVVTGRLPPASSLWPPACSLWWRETGLDWDDSCTTPADQAKLPVRIGLAGEAGGIFSLLFFFSHETSLFATRVHMAGPCLFGRQDAGEPDRGWVWKQRTILGFLAGDGASAPGARINPPHRLRASVFPVPGRRSAGSLCGDPSPGRVTFWGHLFRGADVEKCFLFAAALVIRIWPSAVHERPPGDCHVRIPGRCRFRVGAVCAVRHEQDECRRVQTPIAQNGVVGTHAGSHSPAEKKSRSGSASRTPVAI
jgi:hypothetical protein